MSHEEREKIQGYARKKRELRKEQWRNYQQKKYSPSANEHDGEQSAEAKWQHMHRHKAAEEERRKERRRDYMQEYRTRNKSTCPENDYTFPNRMEKSRYIRKLKNALPRIPEKRAAVLTAYTYKKRIADSPAVTKVYNTLNGDCDLEKTLIEDVNTVIKSVKYKRDEASLATMKILTSSMNGESVSRNKCVKDLSKKLGIRRSTMAAGKILRTQILTSNASAFNYTKRKTRCDAIPKNVKQQAYNFWLDPDSSRPTTNKNDRKRVRLAAKIYSSHEMYILEKTQTEVYQSFTDKFPNAKIGQRTFEKCKPYFVRSATSKDKCTCCCRQHVEMRSLFKTCMMFRRKCATNRQNQENIKIYENLNDLVKDTLCEPSANTKQYNMSCLNRECTDCGVDKIHFMTAENSQTSTHVHWEKYEYTIVKNKENVDVRKLMLVRKQTSPFHMFQYLRDLLQKFPAHQFRATWQNKQLKSITQNLPIGHCIAIHDFSENYKCSEKTEIQASYYQKQEVTLHITILHRHAILEIDAVDSTADKPVIVTEHFIVVSPDGRHDHHFTHTVQELLVNYLQSISYNLNTLHEFTDGCSVQYKSCHCIGDLSKATADFGLTRVMRNYFETSHGRGPQDAAGGLVKRSADMAILRGNYVIQIAKDMYEFAMKHLTNTTEKAQCSRRIFRYVPVVVRDGHRENRYFQPVKNNRKIHQVISTDGKLFSRNLTCYTCNHCVIGQYEGCLHNNIAGNRQEIVMINRSLTGNSTDETDVCEMSLVEEEPPLKDMIGSGTLFAVKADDPVYPYFIVKASGPAQILRKPIVDEWGASFNPGDEIIHGLYFTISDNDILNLHLIKRIKAIVPAKAVIYICNEIEMSDTCKITISDSLHRRMLNTLS